MPAFLKTQHQLEVRERLIRAWVNGEEINFYARARRDGEDVVIVGESIMRLDDGAKFGRLQRKLEAVRAVEALPLVPLLATHFARPDLPEQARQQGIVVVQGLEWNCSLGCFRALDPWTQTEVIRMRRNFTRRLRCFPAGQTQ